MANLVDELRWRGMLQDATDGAAEHLAGDARSAYIGFDPTAASLHVGHLRQVMLLVHLQRHGHRPIALVGGGTGLIGDPSGRDEERQLLAPGQAFENAEALRRQLERFLDFDTRANPARMRNNLAWLGEIRAVDFLRETGKHFRVGDMLRKESVRRRLEDEEGGLSYTEFSYLLLQAFDFLELFRREGCTLQAGGSDQWGNITAGIDLIRRVEGESAYGLVSPLLTTAGGAKFGKTARGAVWLDPARTSPFRFYQFWINTADEDVGPHLRAFTLLERQEIEALEEATAAEPHRRAAQKALAEDVTRRVHGEEGFGAAVRASEALFGGALEGMAAADIADIFADVPSSTVAKADLEAGLSVVDLAAGAGVVPSKSEARRAIEGGGLYVNNERVENVDARIAAGQAIEGRFLVLRRGKKTYHLVRVG